MAATRKQLSSLKKARAAKKRKAVKLKTRRKRITAKVKIRRKKTGRKRRLVK